MPPIPKPNDENPKKSVGNSLAPPSFTVMNSSSDSDEDGADPGDMGYQPLPQEPDTGTDADHEDDVDTGFAAAEATQNVDDLVQDALNDTPTTAQDTDIWAFPENHAAVHERQELWQHTPRPVNVPLDQEKVDLIKSAMKSFVLPASSHPTWASTVPEDQWKQQLLTQLGSKSSQPITSDHPPNHSNIPLSSNQKPTTPSSVDTSDSKKCERL